MTSRRKLWLGSIVLYALFFSWYTDFGGPLTEAEIQAYIAKTENHDLGGHPSARAALLEFLRNDTGGQFLMFNVSIGEKPTPQCTARCRRTNTDRPVYGAHDPCAALPSESSSRGGQVGRQQSGSTGYRRCRGVVGRRDQIFHARWSTSSSRVLRAARFAGPRKDHCLPYRATDLSRRPAPITGTLHAGDHRTPGCPPRAKSAPRRLRLAFLVFRRKLYSLARQLTHTT